LLLRGPTLDRDAWFDTGDLAEQDKKGYYRILGRSRDQINVKGVKLNPQSLESKLLSTIPGIEECAVFGTDSVKCIYTGPADAIEITTFLSSLGNYCRPIVLQQVAEIPKTVSNKVSRTLLNSLF
jgi:acyl-coenzyme A synthetase/AMP-(fatty) acid ligase